jgi:hypothetical protein
MGGLRTAGPLFAVLVACGGRTVSNEVPDAAEVGSPREAGLLCAADSTECALPGATLAPGACTYASLCACHDLSAQGRDFPPSCVAAEDPCYESAAMTTDPACQVAAVQMARCLITEPDMTCRSFYFMAHPAAQLVEPIGMEIALYQCAVCNGECPGPC